tara:strand:+ start:12487 stop:13347 length:861 start_codon:yes stop_codon:yes gene_type:complete
MAYPSIDDSDVNVIDNRTEFNGNVYVYGDLYTESIIGPKLDFDIGGGIRLSIKGNGDSTFHNNVEIKETLNVLGITTFNDRIVGTSATFTGGIVGTSATFTGNVEIGGVLSYEDVTSVDAIGIVTARNDIHVGAGISAVGIVTAQSFRGDGSQLTGVEAFVSGMIIIWSGAANAIPSGFVLCDGNNSTPDLRGRFVVGHHPSNGDYDVNDTGGAESVTLTVNQMPTHNHPTSFDGKKYFPGGGSTSIGFGGAGGYPADVFSMSNNGGSQAHENRPPYFALCYIMKT